MKDAFEAVPWVRKAVVRREFPNRLSVVLQEHQPVASRGADGESRLLNSHGEVFEANVDDVESDDLPRLSGPSGQAAQLLAMYRALAPLFASLEARVRKARTHGWGSWRTQLDTGAVMELGRGTPAGSTNQRFIRTVSRATARYNRRPDAIESAICGTATGTHAPARGDHGHRRSPRSPRRPAPARTESNRTQKQVDTSQRIRRP